MLIHVKAVSEMVQNPRLLMQTQSRRKKKNKRSTAISSLHQFPQKIKYISSKLAAAILSQQCECLKHVWLWTAFMMLLWINKVVVT